VFSQSFSRILVVAVLGLVAANASAQRTIYCYDDENGRRVCGDRIPPEAARLDREVRNSEGVRIGTEQGEITAEEQRQLEEQRALEEERQREAEERRRYGQVLLDSYTSVEDIEQLRDRMLEQISGQIALYEQQLGDLRSKLGELELRRLRFSPYSDREDAPPLPNNIRLDIERTESSIALFEQRLEDSLEDQVETSEHFESDIAYFRELTGDDV